MLKQVFSYKLFLVNKTKHENKINENHDIIMNEYF